MSRCSLIEVRSLSKYYGGRPAIVDLTFTIPAGQVVGLLGPADAGKSTILRILAGLVGPNLGEATVGGLDPRSRESRRRAGYVAGTGPMYNDMRVGPFLETMCRMRGVHPRLRRARIDAALTACRLTEQRRAVIGRLEGDLQRRVALAQAVVHEPEVLLLDDLGAEVRELVAELARGRTVVVAGRTLADLSAACERVLIIRDGRLAGDETPDSLSRRRGERLTVEVLAVVRGDVAPAERQLRRLAGVADVRVEALDSGDQRVTVVGDGEELQDGVARTLIERGISLKELSSRQPKVDDVFADLFAEDPA